MYESFWSNFILNLEDYDISSEFGVLQVFAIF